MTAALRGISASYIRSGLVLCCIFLWMSCSLDPWKPVTGVVIETRVRVAQVVEGADSGAFGAIVGGLLLGPVGAVVGGLSTRNEGTTVAKVTSCAFVLNIEGERWLFAPTSFKPSWPKECETWRAGDRVNALRHVDRRFGVAVDSLLGVRQP